MALNSGSRPRYSLRALFHGSRYLLLCTLPACCVAAPSQTSTSTPAAAARHAIQLVQQGRCGDAVPTLKQLLPRLTEKQVRYHAGMALARCGMGMGDTDTVVSALLLLHHEFPEDPEVLFLSTHYYSELGARSAQELAAKAPHSAQARRLQAEALESQGKNDEAAAIYRQILADSPHTSGIHYRLGQILLAQAGNTGSTDAAQDEFRQELQIDPLNAAAHFVLGELARRSSLWPQAIDHFTQAAKIDPTFAEAFLALGMSQAAAGDFSAAVAPLERYVHLQPDDPAGHYQLAMAYRRTGNMPGATQQLQLQARAAANAQAASDSAEGHTAVQ